MKGKRYIAGAGVGGAIGAKVGIAALGTAFSGVVPLALIGVAAVHMLWPRAKDARPPLAQVKLPPK